MKKIQLNQSARMGIGCLALLVFAFLGKTAKGQIDVTFKLGKTAYIAHEPIVGEVTIFNRAGRDLIMSGKNGADWLEFRINETGGGRMVSPIQGAEKLKPIVIGAGKSYTSKVTVNRKYPMGRTGRYSIQALVSFPQINRVFTARPTAINVNDGRKMWSQVFGVPPGNEGAGSYREYSILTQHHGSRSKTLYFRIAEADTGLVRKTWAIGDYLMVRPPKQVVDGKNILHVFHMAGPKTYVYTTVNVDGKPIEQQVYVQKGTSIPDMVTNESNQVAVVGGMTLEESLENYESREFRNLSERPPGLPKL